MIRMYVTQETCKRRLVFRLLSKVVYSDLRKLFNDALVRALSARHGGAMFTGYNASER